MEALECGGGEGIGGGSGARGGVDGEALTVVAAAGFSWPSSLILCELLHICFGL
jgi:hypothetical protein